MVQAEEIEKEMILVGATAIEDKLQDGVPDTIANLARAGIKIWVLTGDKQETAENIAFACQLLRTDMQLNRVVGGSADEVRAELKAALDRNKEYIGQSTEHLALIVEGKSLIAIMDDPDLTAQLLKFGEMCKAVVACRVSPNQKRQIVAMVRNGVKPAPMTLAIGDGANDVPMIMEAHVGVGISGNEGLQAVRSADYAIAQFRYLNRLLLVHGRNNYIRVSRIILYVFYKNTVCVTALFLYNIYTGWSGTTLFASFLSMSFNFFFTGVPIIVYGFMEQDVKDTTALKNPRLYMPGQRKESFNATVAASWGLNAIVHILLVTFIPIFVMQEANFTDLYVGGTIIMLAQVIGINVRLVLISSHISYISHIVVAVRFSLTYCIYIYKHMYKILRIHPYSPPALHILSHTHLTAPLALSLCSIGLCFAIVLIMSAMDQRTFDIHLYYGAGVKALGDALVWVTILLTFVTMSALDVTHLYLVLPPPTPRAFQHSLSLSLSLSLPHTHARMHARTHTHLYLVRPQPLLPRDILLP